MTAAHPNPMADRLRARLAGEGLLVMPCCHDALSARMIERAGFDLAFLSGFGASAARIGAPDLGLMSYAEVLDQARNAMGAVTIPMIADADTGYGNPMNVERTVEGFARAGAAAVMIEDQEAPKRCGHTADKRVVERAEAAARIRAAMTARARADILILARTDARRAHGLDEAIARGRLFAELGADIVFVEEPFSEAEMARIAQEIPAPSMANLLEGGQTPMLPQDRLGALGFRIAAYPFATLGAAMRAMAEALAALRAGEDHRTSLMGFEEIRDVLGFDAYHAAARRYED
jgi:2-methylisocitrate lyase-like PEP mutase family enzyme